MSSSSLPCNLAALTAAMLLPALARPLPPALLFNVPRTPLQYREILRSRGWRPEDIAALSVAPSRLLAIASGPAVNRKPGANDLYLMRAGTVEALTSDGAGYGYALYSSDEKFAAYMSREGVLGAAGAAAPRAIPWAVYIQSLITGTRYRTFTQPPRPPDQITGALYGWVPGSHGAVFGTTDPPGIYLLRASGRPAIRLLSRFISGITPGWKWAWTGDATAHRVSFGRLPSPTQRLLTPAAWAAMHWYGPYTLPGVPDYTGLGHDDTPVFSADDTRAAVFSDLPGSPARRLMVINLKSGAIHSAGAPPADVGGLVFSADGKRIEGERTGEGGATIPFSVPAN